MTEAEISTIESELSIRLPDAYRKAICPFPVRAYIGNTDTELWDDAAAIIELNRRVHDKEGWPANLFAVGCDGGGVMWAIDLSSAIDELWWVDRAIQAPGTSAYGQSFGDWAAEYLEAMRSGELDEGMDPEKDPPGTRTPYEPTKVIHVVGCLGIIIVIAVVCALVIVGFQVLFGFV
jgi:hypothetical protein